MKKIFISLSMMFFLGLCCASAQEVTLVTSGEGMTKAEATAAALRSAIEQSFETFVSANTTILDDDIVKDEVATVASGNIKSYKELSCTKDQQGIYTVSVSATVSLGKLIEYAKSHGSSAEFAGQTFAMNIKMRELNKKNEAEALRNLIIQLKTMKNNLFDYKIQVNDPQHRPFDGTYNIPVNVQIVTNENYVNFIDILTNTLNALSIQEDELSAMHKSGNYSENELGLNLKWENTYFLLRSELSVVKSFTKDLCKILNDAQRSFCVNESGGRNSCFQLNDRSSNVLKKFGTTNSGSISKILLGIQNDSAYGENVGKFPIGNEVVISSLSINYNYTVDELGSVNGYSVKNAPISQ